MPRFKPLQPRSKPTHHRNVEAHLDARLDVRVAVPAPAGLPVARSALADPTVADKNGSYTAISRRTEAAPTLSYSALCA